MWPAVYRGRWVSLEELGCSLPRPCVLPWSPVTATRDEKSVLSPTETGTGTGRWDVRGIAALVTLAGCAPSLATLQPAHVAPKGHVQVTAGMEVGIPTGTVGKVVDAARTLAETAKTQQITDDQKVQLFDAGVNLLASPPSAQPLFSIAYTIVDRTEIGLRYAGAGWRLGGRYQPLRHQEGPFDLVLGLGVARATTPIPVDKVLPVLEASDFTRYTFDVSALIGTFRDFFRVWVGPKVLYSRFDSTLRLNLFQMETQLATFEGDALYIGGQGGVAVGYRYVFFGVELTMGGLSGSATATTTLVAAQRRTDISGFVIYPAFALMGEF